MVAVRRVSGQARPGQLGRCLLSGGAGWVSADGVFVASCSSMDFIDVSRG